MLSFVFQPFFQRSVFPLLALLFLISCGSYEAASYAEDGIYTPVDQRARAAKKAAQVPQTETLNGSTYKDYFAQRGTAYGKILEGDIFIDTDRYSGPVAAEEFSPEEERDAFSAPGAYSGNAGWGDHPSGVTVTIHNTPGWGGYYGWGYPYWGFRYGRGGYPYWNSYGNYGYGWGGYSSWNYPYWGYPYGNYGYGWGGYYAYPGNHFYSYGSYSPKRYTQRATRRGYSNSATSRTTRSGNRYAPSYRPKSSNPAINSSSRYRTSTSPSRSYRSSGSSNSGRSSGSYRSSGSSGRATSGGSSRRR